MRVRIPILCFAALATAEEAWSQDSRRVPLPPDYIESVLEFSGSVKNLVEFTDGTCLIVDVRADQIRIIDWGSNTTRALGSRGRGPNEYMSIERLVDLGGDSALIADRAGSKLLVATNRQVRDAGKLPASSPHTSYLRGADGSGRLLQVTGFRFRWPASDLSDNGPLSSAESIFAVVVRPDDASRDTVGRLRGPGKRLIQTTMKVGEGRGTMPAEIGNPIAGGDAVAMFPDGWIAIAHRDRYRVDWLTPAGAPVRGVQLDDDFPRMDNRLKNWFLRDLKMLAPNIGPGSFDDWPRAVPPFVGDAIVQSHDGRVLVARLMKRPGNREYDVINRKGQREMILVTPGNVAILLAGRLGIYALATDADGVQHLRRYQNPLR
jgi:hypothetical protein